MCGAMGKEYFLTDHPVFRNSTSVRLPSVCQAGQLQPRATPQSQHRKYKMAFHVYTQLASITSEACGNRFENRMLCLSTVLSLWTNGEDISAVDERVEIVTTVPQPFATASLFSKLVRECFFQKGFFAVFIATTWVHAELKVQIKKITIVCFRSARFDNGAIYDTTPPGDNRTTTGRNGCHSRNWYVNVFVQLFTTNRVHAELKVQIKQTRRKMADAVRKLLA